MGTARLAIYLVGLIVVVTAIWVFLTQTEVGRSVPTGIAMALILLLVGIGIMASARQINDHRVSRRYTHEGGSMGGPTTRVYDTRYAPPPAAPPAYDSETVVEERRYD